MARETGGRPEQAVRADRGGRADWAAVSADRPAGAARRCIVRVSRHRLLFQPIAVVFGALALLPAATQAEDPGILAARVASVKSRAEGIAAFKPRVRGLLPNPVWQRLALAFPVAVAQVRAAPGCQALFQRLGGDGVEALVATRYVAVASTGAEDACRPGVAAFTMVHSPLSYLCPAYGTLDTRRAALTLIHEALHYAGLTERPSDPQGLNANQINRMVKINCGL